MKQENLLYPLENELPSEFADRTGIAYSKSVSSGFKKTVGQFFTPVQIAKLMASFCRTDKTELKIMDPGCGVAILSCSLIEHLVQQSHNIKNIELIGYDTDQNIISYTESVMLHLKEWLKNEGVHLNYILTTDDFVLANRNRNDQKLFDFIISNPPYFKLKKNDERVVVAKNLIGSNTNIYSIFLGLASQMLAPDGDLVFITPRSFASGNYFKDFRSLFFQAVNLDRVHLFGSRKSTFSRDKVLQETVILKASKQINSKDVIISSSDGLNDLEHLELRKFDISDIIDLESSEMILHLPINEKEEAILNLVETWKYRLIDHNIQISTGPVVSFRAKQFIKQTEDNGNITLAPLFWLHNVHKMELHWPLEYKDKGQYIQIEEKSKSILIPNKDYILLRRFSTKDDKSRLIASPYFSDETVGFIGVENKVNYIYRPKGNLERLEILGLCALLNSELFDTYFQIFNGNVNVSATELREMKFPALNEIKEIGRRLVQTGDYSMDNINSTVNIFYNIEQLLVQL